MFVAEGRKPIQYLDIKNEKQDKDATRMANELRELKVIDKLEKTNWRAYEVEWIGMCGQKYAIINCVQISSVKPSFSL